MNPKSENESMQQIRQLTIATILTINTDTQEKCKILQQWEVSLERTQRRLKKHRYRVVAPNKGL